MKRYIIPAIIIVLSFAGFLLWNGTFTGVETGASFSGTAWNEYLGGPGCTQYTTLTRIDKSNVHELEVAWEYNTGVFGEMQTNPLIVNDTLYGMTANLQPFALNAATGEEYWRRTGDEVGSLSNSRGVVYWKDDEGSRILYTNGPWLYAVNANTGDPYFPIEDRQVPISDIPGEQTWPTQPFPVKPAPYARQPLLPLRLPI